VDRAFSKIVDWYVSIDRRVLGAFRVAYGLVLFYDLARRAEVLELAYSNDGVLSNHFVMFSPQAEYQFSLLDAFSTPNEVRLAFGLIALVYALYTVGLFTRIASVLALVSITSLNSRNLFLEDGGVSILIALGVWTVFLPVGEYLSLDSLRTEASLGSARERVAWRQRANTPAVSIAVLALWLQLIAIYWLNAANKSGDTWRNGEAVHYVLWQQRVVTDLGFWLARHEPAWFSPVSTYVTLALEWALPVFALWPVGTWPRVAAFAAAVALHGGIALLMTLGPFSYAMVTLVALRLPWPVLAGLGRRAPSRLRRRLARWRSQMVRALHASTYDVARRRRPRDSPLGLHPLREAVVAVLMAAALADMSQHNPAFPFHLGRQRWLRPVSGYPRSFQRWYMFAPDAPREDGAAVIDATTESGRHVDPFTGAEPNFQVLEQGPLPHGSIPADYLYQIHLDGNRPYRSELARYLRRWHERSGRGDEDRIKRFEFWWLSRRSPTPGSTRPGSTRRELVFRGP
jgi:uncharacterized membrane protein YfbV (UPF0208 family)